MLNCRNPKMALCSVFSWKRIRARRVFTKWFLLAISSLLDVMFEAITGVLDLWMYHWNGEIREDLSLFLPCKGKITGRKAEKHLHSSYHCLILHFKLFYLSCKTFANFLAPPARSRCLLIHLFLMSRECFQFSLYTRWLKLHTRILGGSPVEFAWFSMIDKS